MTRLGRAITEALWTPTLWCTIAGVVLGATGHFVAAAVLFLIVGWGGAGIAVHIGVQEDRDPWRIDTVVEAIVAAVKGERLLTLVGLLLHLPQAIAGVLLLWFA